MYCIFETKDARESNQILAREQRGDNRELNNGRPWLCKDESGLTGFMGMIVMADTIEEAREKIMTIRENFHKADEEPQVWA